ncbi:hypothetical protein AWH56_018440 [Anaerobacillus isosaccharinicus]|uniref:Uncharacterized protein n=1 Tax=Anaerobacillus isosaccharinicus TaxID=1532552 RepID=A0A1S2MFT9_9BACI|nr:hypothetical protein [Anaerobacillus isosaccharinicus]MBA5587116.1 hypothetical protein [Anaerobacillus isosaccharinicus]QOY34688.1 hypothetical protein AWH56_018440 [Anaerobacillus isosaccharinicus]
MLNKKREPKKTWYWVPFVGAIVMSILLVLQVNYLKTPKRIYWTPPDTGDLLRATWYGIVMIIIFTIQGINGLYQYKKQKGKNE